jgi:hypothetical protein
MLSTLRDGSARLIVALALPMVLALGGCASTPQKPIADWHDAVVAVQGQSTTVFRSTNDLIRETQIRRAGTLAALKESDFQPGLDAESLAVWDRAFDSLAQYSAALTTLLNPELAAGVGASTQLLGEQIATTAKSDILTKRPGLASALGKLGAKLTSLAAGAKARDIMAEANPAVNEVLAQMARMIYDDSGGIASGVYPTVHADWTLRADEIRAEFLTAQSPDAKRSVATRYAATLEKRDAADSALLGLRASITELAAAHGRAALGAPMDTAALIGNVREQTAFVKGLLTDLKPAKN